MSHQDNEYEVNGMEQVHAEVTLNDQDGGEAPAYIAQFREKPDGAIDPAGEAGWFLQREREKRGETLDYIAEVTAIHPYHLEAIEFGDMTHMPARLEALEMISVYAQYLGFDPEPLVQHYIQFLPKPALAPRSFHPADPAPLSSAKVLTFGKLPKLPAFKLNLSNIPGGPGGLVAGVAGAVFLFAAASWLMMPAHETSVSDPDIAVIADPMSTASTGAQSAPTIPQSGMSGMAASGGMPEITADQLPYPTGAGATASGTQAGTIPDGDVDGLGALINNNAQTPAAGKLGKKGKPQAAAQQVPQPVAKGATTVAAAGNGAVQTGNGRVFGATNQETRLVLKAKGPVYVRIEDAQGQLVMTQTLNKGDIIKVPERAGLVIYAKDGGQITYAVDGKDKGVMGPVGEILAGRSLDIIALQG